MSDNLSPERNAYSDYQDKLTADTIDFLESFYKFSHKYNSVICGITCICEKGQWTIQFHHPHEKIKREALKILDKVD